MATQKSPKSSENHDNIVGDNKIVVQMPESQQGKDIFVKISDPNQQKKDTQSKFRSFHIPTSAGIPLFNSKRVFVYDLLDLLQKNGLSPDIPVRYTRPNNDTQKIVCTFDWNPHGYKGKKAYPFLWDETQCAITGNYCDVWIRVYDMKLGSGENIIKSILTALEAYYIPPTAPTGKLNIYTTQKSMSGYVWNNFCTRKHRDIDTIYINPAIKDKIVHGLERFYKSDELYDRFGITYKRVHMFHGPPGTGKTSTVLALASIFKKNIAKLTITPHMDSQSLEGLFKSLPSNTFLILEDVDGLFVGREGTNSIDFSTLLNCMDGLTTRRGLVVFMTTNHVTKLDSAFVRPGRVDISVEFPLPTRNTLLQTLENLGPQYSHEHELYLKRNPDIIIPDIQKHLFDCIMDERDSILK